MAWPGAGGVGIRDTPVANPALDVALDHVHVARRVYLGTVLPAEGRGPGELADLDTTRATMP